jgi:hypothetical protein
LRKLHLVVGLAGVLAFVLSGQYMPWALEVRLMDAAPRTYTRGTHIFLMYASVLNVVLGCFLIRAKKRVPRILQAIASWAILVGPFLLVGSFLGEPFHADLERPLSRVANLLAFGGTFLYFLAYLADRKGRVVQEVRSQSV